MPYVCVRCGNKRDGGRMTKRPFKTPLNVNEHQGCQDFCSGCTQMSYFKHVGNQNTYAKPNLQHRSWYETVEEKVPHGLMRELVPPRSWVRYPEESKNLHPLFKGTPTNKAGKSYIIEKKPRTLKITQNPSSMIMISEPDEIRSRTVGVTFASGRKQKPCYTLNFYDPNEPLRKMETRMLNAPMDYYNDDDYDKADNALPSDGKKPWKGPRPMNDAERQAEWSTWNAENNDLNNVEFESRRDQYELDAPKFCRRTTAVYKVTWPLQKQMAIKFKQLRKLAWLHERTGMELSLGKRDIYDLECQKQEEADFFNSSCMRIKSVKEMRHQQSGRKDFERSRGGYSFQTDDLQRMWAMPEPPYEPYRQLGIRSRLMLENMLQQALAEDSTPRILGKHEHVLHEERELKMLGKHRLGKVELQEQVAQQERELQEKKLMKQQQLLHRLLEAERQQHQLQKVKKRELMKLKNAKLQQKKLLEQKFQQQQKMQQRKQHQDKLDHKRRMEELRNEQLRLERLREDKMHLEMLRQKELREEEIYKEELRQEGIRQEKLRQEQIRQEELRREQLRQEELQREQQLRQMEVERQQLEQSKLFKQQQPQQNLQPEHQKLMQEVEVQQEKLRKQMQQQEQPTPKQEQLEQDKQELLNRQAKEENMMQRKQDLRLKLEKLQDEQHNQKLKADMLQNNPKQKYLQQQQEKEVKRKLLEEELYYQEQKERQDQTMRLHLLHEERHQQFQLEQLHLQLQRKKQKRKPGDDYDDNYVIMSPPPDLPKSPGSVLRALDSEELKMGSTNSIHHMHIVHSISTPQFQKYFYEEECLMHCMYPSLVKDSDKVGRSKAVNIDLDATSTMNRVTNVKRAVSTGISVLPRWCGNLNVYGNIRLTAAAHFTPVQCADNEVNTLLKVKPHAREKRKVLSICHMGTPFRCPDSSCKRLFFISDFALHLVQDHRTLTVERISMHSPKTFLLDPRVIVMGKVKCHMVYLLRDNTWDESAGKLKNLLPLMILTMRCPVNDIYNGDGEPLYEFDCENINSEDDEEESENLKEDEDTENGEYTKETEDMKDDEDMNDTQDMNDIENMRGTNTEYTRNTQEEMSEVGLLYSASGTMLYDGSSTTELVKLINENKFKGPKQRIPPVLHIPEEDAFYAKYVEEALKANDKNDSTSSMDTVNVLDQQDISDTNDSTQEKDDGKDKKASNSDSDICAMWICAMTPQKLHLKGTIAVLPSPNAKFAEGVLVHTSEIYDIRDSRRKLDLFHSNKTLCLPMALLYQMSNNGENFVCIQIQVD